MSTYDPNAKLTISSGPVGQTVSVSIGDLLIPVKAVDIRIRPDEFVEVDLVVRADAIDVSALQAQTKLIVEGQG